MTMETQPKLSPLGLIAGKGDLPRFIVEVCKSQGRPVYILALEGQAESELLQNANHLWVHFGEIGKSVKYFQKNGIHEIVLAGGIARPSLKDIKPDIQGAIWLAKIGAKAFGDDNILKILISLMESEGFKIVGAHEIIEESLTPAGKLGQFEPDSQAVSDIERGISILKTMSDLDIGQAVVVQQGLVLGVEAIEGTDALIDRAGGLKRNGEGPILIKIAKRSQENRADLPTIGPETIKNMHRAGIRGVAIEARRSLLLHRSKTIHLANDYGIFILGINVP